MNHTASPRQQRSTASVSWRRALDIGQGDRAVNAGAAQGATEISSETFDIGKVGESVFEGGVEMRRGAEWLGTDSLRYDHATGGYVTEGGVRFQNAGMRMTAETAAGNDKAGSLEMGGLHYQFHAGNGNGMLGLRDLATFDGHALPSDRSQISPLTCLVHYADVYLAKLSPRATRGALASTSGGSAPHSNHHGDKK